MTTPLPGYVVTGTVKGKAYVVTADTVGDVDTEPDAAYPVGATLKFAPTVPLLVFKKDGQKSTVYLSTITAVIDSSGNPVTAIDESGAPTNGEVLKLVANKEQPDNVQTWQYLVTVKIGATTYTPFGFDVHGGVDNYLADQQPAQSAAIITGLVGPAGPAGPAGPPGPSALPNTGTLTYDGSGNVLTDTEGRTYTYNGDGTVLTISDGTTTRTLAYNADGTVASVA